MLELEIQKLLKNNIWEDCQKKLDELDIKWHYEISPISGKEYLHLDYSVMSDRKSEITKECRGLVLEKDSWSIIRYGFRRFMNYGETGEDKFDSKGKYEYEEKVDGSIIILSFFNEDDQWIAGTRGKIFPDQKINGRDLTFTEMFWETFMAKDKLDKNICYMFEICGPENRIVVPYNRQVVLIGARDRNNDWQEIKSEQLDNMAECFSVRRPKNYRFDKLKDCLEKCKTLPGYQEGFVLKQWNENEKRYSRVKIKGENYLDLHRIVSGKSLNNLVKLVLRGEKDSLSIFPEYMDAYNRIEEKFDMFAQEATRTYDKNKSILNDPSLNIGFKERRKMFAQEVSKTQFASICFALADGKFDTSWDYFKNSKGNGKTKKIIEQFDIAKIVDSTWSIVENEDEDV